MPPPTGDGTAVDVSAVRAFWTRVYSPAGLVALMVLLICVPVQISLGGTVFGPADVASGLLVAVVVLRAFRVGSRLSVANAVLFGSIVVATSIVAIAGLESGPSLSGWVRYLQLFALVPVAVVLALRDRRDAELVANALVAAGVVQGVVCVLQVLSGTGATFQGQDYRAVGTFGAMDVIAASVILGLAITVCVGFATSTTGRRRLVYAALALGLLLPLLLTLSRGSWLATAAAVMPILLYAGVRLFVATIVCGVAAAVVLLGVLAAAGVQLATIGDRLGSIGDEADSSQNDRTALWTAAVKIWIDHPVTGVGLKAFPRYRDSYASLSLSGSSTVGQSGSGGGGIEQQELLSPHNQYLLVLSEQGAVGFVPLLVLLVATAGATLRTSLRGPPRGRGLGAAVFGISLWQLIQFLVGDVGGLTSVITSLILGLGAWYGLEQQALAGAAAADGVAGPHADRTAS